MMATNLTIGFYRGDHVEITFEVEGTGSIAAWTFDFGIWRNSSAVATAGNEKAVAYKTLADGITIVDAVERTVMVTLDAETTSKLQQGGFHGRFRRTNEDDEAVLAVCIINVGH